MRHTRLIVIFAALLLGACSGAQQAAQPRAQPANPPTAAPAAPNPAPTESAFVNSDSVPAPSPTTADAAAANPPLPTEPTARLILPPVPTTPAADNAPQLPLTPTADAAAAPAPAAQPAPASASSEPVRLVIKDAGLDGKVMSVGLDKNRVPIVPEHNVGWYNLSAQPGQGENIVLWGHVLRFRNAPTIPAPFAHLKEVQPGAAVILYDKTGSAHKYVVTQQIWVTPDQVEYILPRGKEMVTMVSCIGDKVIVGNEVVDESHRLITIAEPAS